jgi:hypothetical protein
MPVVRWCGGGDVATKFRRRWELQDLEPKWTPVEHGSLRYNVGFGFDCPVHGTHRLYVRLDAPYDGFEYIDGPGVLVHLVENGSFDTLTLENLAGGDTIDFPLCAELRIICGRVELVLPR